MIYQIAGIVIVSVCLICFTWYKVTLNRETAERKAVERHEREARNERMYNNEAFMMYEEERARRMQAETRCGILEHQLDRARKQMASMKVKEAKA